jgi:hypothetical protein
MYSTVKTGLLIINELPHLYRDWGWEAVQALENSCRVEGGYTGIKNVYQVKYSFKMSRLSVIS